MDKVSEVTVVLRLPKPISVSQEWPKSIRELLVNIGHLRKDGTEVIAFAHGNALQSQEQKNDF